MPSRAELRRAGEWVLRTALVAGLALALWRAVRERAPGAEPRAANSGSLARALDEATRSARVGAIDLEIDGMPSIAQRAWLAALHASGVPVRWRGTPPALGLSAERVREPDAAVPVLLAANVGIAGGRPGPSRGLRTPPGPRRRLWASGLREVGSSPPAALRRSTRSVASCQPARECAYRAASSSTPTRRRGPICRCAHWAGCAPTPCRWSANREDWPRRCDVPARDAYWLWATTRAGAGGCSAAPAGRRRIAPGGRASSDSSRRSTSRRAHRPPAAMPHQSPRS